MLIQINILKCLYEQLVAHSYDDQLVVTTKYPCGWGGGESRILPWKMGEHFKMCFRATKKFKSTQIMIVLPNFFL